MSWTEQEKRDLLLAMEAHGPNDLEEIQKFIPDRSITEIRCTIDKYKHMAASKAKRLGATKLDETPLNQWIHVMEHLRSNSQDADDFYPRLFKYIAMFEHHTEDAGVNLKDCYLAISELMKGENIKLLDPYTVYFLNKSLSNLAHKVQDNDNTEMLKFVKSIDNLEDLTKANLIKSYSKKKEDFRSNPLRIPASLLKLKDNTEGPSTSTQR